MAKTDTSHHDERIAKMTFASVYPHYVAKLEQKGRTKKELDEMIEWLTWYDAAKFKELAAYDINFQDFFKQCDLNSNSKLITGVICGYRVKGITNDITRQVRYMDKLADELAKGKKMEKILRSWCGQCD